MTKRDARHRIRRRASVRTVGAGLALVLGLGLATPTAAFDIAGASANLTWSPASGPVAGYGVFVSRNGAAYPSTPSVTVPSPAVTVNGAPGDTVSVRVAAFDVSGDFGPISPESEPLVFVASGSGGSAPSIVLNTGSLSVSTPAGQSPANVTFSVRNGGAGALAWSTSESTSWFSLSPASGTSNGEADSVTVSFSTSTLAAGSYSGVVTVSGTGAASKTLTVTVTVTGALPPPPPPSNPVIGLSTTSLQASGSVGSAVPAVRFGVRNAGTGTLGYTVSDDAGWMSVSPGSGTSAGESDPIVVSFATAGLTVGSYTGTITVGGAGLASQTVTVRLVLGGSGERFDFDGDGTPEVLWSRPASGAVELWDVGASGVSADTPVTAATAGWVVVGVADFDGDGHDDVLWRTDVPGQYSLWYMNGATRLSTATLQAPPNHEALATGDFDADGKADVLWTSLAGDNMRLTLLRGSTNVAAAPQNNWPLGAGWLPIGCADFNGDGRDDILWRNDAGTIAIWFMSGAGYIGAGVVTTLDTSWYIAGAADFNHDGKADLLLHQLARGDFAVWYLSGTQIVAGVYLGQGMDKRLEIAAVGDFDDDGRADVIVRNSQTGAVSLWRTPTSNGFTAVSLPAQTDPEWKIANPWSLAWPKPKEPSTPGDLTGDHSADVFWTDATTGAVEAWQVAPDGSSSTLTLPTGGPGWVVEAIDDFDGDGKSDVLWWTPGTSTLTLWRMNGATRLSTATIQPPAGFRVETVGDFDGDQKADILWRDDVRQLVRVTLLKGGTNVLSAPSATWGASPTWTALGAADFNGDGKDDLVWREAGGAMAIWIMSGTTLVAGTAVGNVGPTWVVAGASDVDGDNSADLVLRETVNGQNAVWLIRGGSLAGGFFLPLRPGSVNQPVAVRDVDGDGRADIVWYDTSTGGTTLWTKLGANTATTRTLPTRSDLDWKISSGW